MKTGLGGQFQHQDADDTEDFLRLRFLSLLYSMRIYKTNGVHYMKKKPSGFKIRLYPCVYKFQRNKKERSLLFLPKMKAVFMR